MKKIVKIIVALILISGLFVACDLDLTPSGSIAQGEALKSVDDAQKFSNGLTSKFRACFYGIFSFTEEVQGNMFNAGLDYGNRNGQPHRMDGSFTTSDYSLRDVWHPIYNLILNANFFIDNVGTVETEDDADKAKIQEYLGYAHFYRAAAYHELMRRYATKELGVPLVLKVDIAEKPARATSASVYAQINLDIVAAYAGLVGVVGKAGSNTPSIDAVKALDARVKFYTGDLPGAAALAKELIDAGKYPLQSTEATIEEEWRDDSGDETILQLFINQTEPSDTDEDGYASDYYSENRNVIYLAYSAADKVYKPDFIPTQTCLDMYEATDLRYKVWFKELPVLINAKKGNLVLFNKYPGNPNNETAPSKAYKNSPKVLRIAEMYLIRAEALVGTNNGESKIALNALQAARGATQTAATVGTVRAEWLKETIGEGFVIDCYKRWNIGFSGRIPQDEDFVNIGSRFNKIVVPAGFDKLTWAIPDSDVQVNPNLVQNPGW